jgi:NTP pyrophosphatase (non-canonical NTP hydrolase)
LGTSDHADTEVYSSMNKQQFLLLKLAEECSEVAQRALKQIQFGKSEIQKDQSKCNAERLTDEIMDLSVLVRLLQEESEVLAWTHRTFEAAKKKKVKKLQKYLDLSRSLGQLPEIWL